MPLLEEEYRKEEKINGVIYDMSPSPNYQHGIVDGNIYSIIKSGLKEHCAWFSWRIWIINIMHRRIMIM